MTERSLATVRDYDGLVAALRDWVRELGTAGETIDHVAGLPLRYTMKLLAPVPVKGLGRTSLGPLLGALGLKLIVAVDHEVLEQIRPRLIPRAVKRADARGGMLARHRPKKSALRGNSAWGRMMQARWSVLKSPKQRSAIARTAANARWAKRASARACSPSPSATPSKGGPGVPVRSESGPA